MSLVTTNCFCEKVVENVFPTALFLAAWWILKYLNGFFLLLKYGNGKEKGVARL
jgi:hypothetical protein